MRRLRRPAAGFAIALALGGCSAAVASAAPPQTPAPSPADSLTGEQRFNQTCAACHGERGRGTPSGPPLVHKIYEPGHHSDAAFMLAVRNGVTQHHWTFGNMPPQPQVSDAQVRLITAYVRGLQREAGIR